MGTGDMENAFKRSLNDPAGFWGEAAEAVHWHKKWKSVLDNSRQPFYRWFAGGEVNTCYNALDLHIEGGRGDQPALIYDSAVTNSITTFTYRELRDKVAVFAGALARLGVGKGDRVIIYMPMVPEAAVAMLACARLGSGALRGVRRLCCKRTGHAYRRCQAESGRLRLVRCGGEENNSLQTSPRRSASNCQAQTREVCDFAARDGARRTRGRARLRLE